MNNKKTTGPNGKTQNTRPGVDPIYDIPLIGSIVKEADVLRTKLQGSTITHREAELLRTEARALRHLANYLETRAVQLERLVQQDDDAPRITRIQVEK